MKYLLLIEADGQWHIATKDGKLVVTEKLDFWHNKEMPAVGYHEKSTVPMFDIDAELSDVYRELDDAQQPY